MDRYALLKTGIIAILGGSLIYYAIYKLIGFML